MTQVLLFGAGNMGFAMLRRWVGIKDDRFAVVEPNEMLSARALEVGAHVYSALTDLPDGFCADVVVIATKPDVVSSVIATCQPWLAKDGLIISVAAGVSINAMRAGAEGRTALIRSMPNTPAAIGEGMIVCCTSDNTSIAQRDTANRLLSSIGQVVFIEDEALMDAVTAVSGSGPAYVFHFLEAFSAAAISAGLSPELAMTLVKQTVLGSAKLALESPMTPTVLREQVTSPGGTTAAALQVLMRPGGGVAQLLAEAVDAAKTRCTELGAGSPS